MSSTRWPVEVACGDKGPTEYPYAIYCETCKRRFYIVAETETEAVGKFHRFHKHNVR